MAGDIPVRFGAIGFLKFVLESLFEDCEEGSLILQAMGKFLLSGVEIFRRQRSKG